MDIFISGDLTTFALTLTTELLKDGHSVVVSSETEQLVEIKNRNFTAYEISSEDTLFGEIFHSHTFDVVVHIAAKQDGVLDKNIAKLDPCGSNLDQILSLSADTNVSKFIFVSSLDIYGDIKTALEEQSPEPNTSYGQILINSENLCRFYAANNDLLVSIIRIPYIYGPHEENSLLSRLIRRSKTEKEVAINTNRYDHCNFLHIDDLISFIKKVIGNQKDYGFQIFNLAVEDINFDFLSQQLNLQFPDVKYNFAKNETKDTMQKKIEIKNAEITYNWTPKHTLFNDLPLISKSIIIEPEKKHSFSEKLIKLTAALQPFLAWIEVILGAFLMHMLTVWTHTVIEFVYIDFRLIFIVIIGSIHGLLFGIIAALLATVSALFAWNFIKFDFTPLIHSVENWIPFAVYFLAGAVTGYAHDKKKNEIIFVRNQAALIQKKYESLYFLYSEISTIKNRLRKQ